MDKRKSKPQTLAVVDELALAKSAAWAWYQHGSGSDGRSIREIDGWRTKIEPKPSRYKLEALRNVQPQSNLPIMLSTSPRSSMSLLDNYEIDRISRQLDYYIESSHAKYHDSGGGPVAEAVAEIENNKVVRKKKIAKGFRLRHVPACGSSIDDVVDTRRRPEKGGVAVVEVSICRPRRF
ncbi:hypothetical protein DH2020_038840 [Rehmannia glutinosa]|uniref:Uncharacterized protein n=1 Tax=Rehmannia glutinosa TaxID=99300 RepID=A0ABR0UXH4_REHGL